MLVALGGLALPLALAFALFAGIAALAGAWRRDESLVLAGERAVIAVFALLTLAMVGLEAALLGDRFDLAFVAQISSREQPWMFKAALWGGQSGSLLLWTWMLGFMSFLVVLQNRTRNRVLMPYVVAILMLNVGFFGGIVTFLSNPFDVLPPGQAWSSGQGMNPLLQHPVMLIHPPILYVGFIGFAVPFAFAAAALATGELGTTWFATTRRWTLTAWFFLGIGLMLGGRWAYEVLGWGGYWAWDPVENSSFMPWLVGTAFLHSVMIQEKKGMLRVWNFALIGLAYVLCVFGTFLTRSGVVQSVHAFANAGWFGKIFLAYVVLLALLYTVLLVRRLPELKSSAKIESFVSREASFLLNNYALIGIAAIVFTGTMLPVYSQGIFDEELTLGPPWFQLYVGPVSLVLLFLMGIGPMIAWKRARMANLRRAFIMPGLMGVGSAIALVAFGMREFYPIAFLALGVFVLATIADEYARGLRARARGGEKPLTALVGLFRKNARRYGGYIVHAAVVLMFVGFAGAAFNLETTKLLKPGEKWDVGGYTLEYRAAHPVSDPHFAGAIARVAVYRDGDPVAMLTPEKRIYFQQEQPATLPAVASSLTEDLYVILAGLEPDQSAALKVYVNPLVNWIWLGGLVFVLGNTILLWTRAEPRSA